MRALRSLADRPHKATDRAGNVSLTILGNGVFKLVSSLTVGCRNNTHTLLHIEPIKTNTKTITSIREAWSNAQSMTTSLICRRQDTTEKQSSCCLGTNCMFIHKINMTFNAIRLLRQLLSVWLPRSLNKDASKFGYRQIKNFLSVLSEWERGVEGRGMLNSRGLKILFWSASQRILIGENIKSNLPIMHTFSHSEAKRFPPDSLETRPSDLLCNRELCQWIIVRR